MVASTDELAGRALAETEAEAPARRRPTAPARRTAFALLCRMLSHSDTPPAGFDRDAAEIDWVTLIEIANRHRVVANLAAAAAARPWPADPAPDVMAYLALVHEAQAEHNRAIRRQILDLAALLAEAGIPFAFLKGANWLMEAAEPELGNSMLTDIDLVLAPHAWDRALASLEGAGFRPATDAAIYRRRESPQRSALV